MQGMARHRGWNAQMKLATAIGLGWGVIAVYGFVRWGSPPSRGLPSMVEMVLLWPAMATLHLMGPVIYRLGLGDAVMATGGIIPGTLLFGSLGGLLAGFVWRSLRLRWMHWVGKG